MTLDPNVQTMLTAMASLGLPPISEMDPADARERMAAMRAQRPAAPPEPGTTEDITINDGLKVRRYRPEGEANGTVVYYHGGGWVLGTLDDFEGVAARLATESGAEVISVDYRLAPEHVFPAAVDDAYAAAVWAAEQSGGPIVVAGDSAGGNLAAVVAQLAKEKGGPDIALQVLVYPVTDYEPAKYPSHAENGGGEYMLGTKDMEWFFGHYVPDAADRLDPRVSPIRAADLSGLPPALVLVAGYDPLRDEGVAYAEALKEAGVHVELTRYDGMIHGFFGMLGLLADSDAAVAAVGKAIRETASAPA